MIDVLLLAEWLWCMVMFFGAKLEKTLILAGGIVTSGYTATMVAPWMTKTFMPPSSTVYRWTLANISQNTIAVNSIAKYIPPEATATTEGHVQWITTHVLLSFMFVAVTLSVFVCFVVVVLLRNALWDRATPPETLIRRISAVALQAFSSTYILVISAVMLGNLAWLHSFSWLQNEVNQSLLMNWVGFMVSQVI